MRRGSSPQSASPPSWINRFTLVAAVVACTLHFSSIVATRVVQSRLLNPGGNMVCWVTCEGELTRLHNLAARSEGATAAALVLISGVAAVRGLRWGLWLGPIAGVWLGLLLVAMRVYR
jgi:hypothetical protein